jgi:hypothetical protein
MAAIMFGAGVMVEFYAVLFAPLGYQDEQGFHAVADGAEEEERGLWGNPS